jgi:hypothetical protein
MGEGNEVSRRDCFSPDLLRPSEAEEVFSTACSAFWSSLIDGHGDRCRAEGHTVAEMLLELRE